MAEATARGFISKPQFFFAKRVSPFQLALGGQGYRTLGSSPSSLSSTSSRSSPPWSSTIARSILCDCAIKMLGRLSLRPLDLREYPAAWTLCFYHFKPWIYTNTVDGVDLLIASLPNEHGGSNSGVTFSLCGQ